MGEGSHSGEKALARGGKRARPYLLACLTCPRGSQLTVGVGYWGDEGPMRPEDSSRGGTEAARKGGWGGGAEGVAKGSAGISGA